MDQWSIYRGTMVIIEYEVEVRSMDWEVELEVEVEEEVENIFTTLPQDVTQAPMAVGHGVTYSTLRY